MRSSNQQFLAGVVRRIFVGMIAGWAIIIPLLAFQYFGGLDGPLGLPILILLTFSVLWLLGFVVDAGLFLASELSAARVSQPAAPRRGPRAR